jgi:hypothetical protein
MSAQSEQLLAFVVKGICKIYAEVGNKSVIARVDNDNHFASFFAKKGLQTWMVFREKMM